MTERELHRTVETLRNLAMATPEGRAAFTQATMEVMAPLAEHEEMDRWKRLPLWAQQELEQWRLDEANQRGRAEAALRALESIGKNTCGREPLAAAYARGMLSELT